MNSVLNFRCEPAMLARVNWLAEFLEIGQGDLLRSLCEGTRSIDGVDLSRTLHRLAMADPANLDDVELAYDSTVAGRLRAAQEHAANA